MISPIRKFRRLLRRLLKDVHGGEAIEFAVVSAPFIALVFGMFELGMVFMVSTTLENATDEVSRQIRTGALQTSGGNAATIKTAICSELSWLGASCAGNLNVDVRSFTSFAGESAPPNPVATGTVDPAKFCWDPGGAGSVVLVRAYYTWTLILPVLNSGLQSTGATGKRLITTATSFRNEPYATTTTAPVTCPTLP
jgi:Flp pilus assembly protein TadG